MKRFYSPIILFVVLLMAAGCGRQASGAAGFSEEDLYLNVRETRCELGVTIETVTAALGDDYEYSEAQSCDYDGLDKTFVYDVAQFYTYPLPEGDVVNEVYTASPEVTTSKGIRVGAAKEDVLAAYGADCEDTGYQLIYRAGDSQGGSLCFDVENGAVTAIYTTSLPV